MRGSKMRSLRVKMIGHRTSACELLRVEEATGEFTRLGAVENGVFACVFAFGVKPYVDFTLALQ